MESPAEDFKLIARGRQPSFFSLLFDLVCLFCFIFQVKCLPFKFGGAFSYVVPDLCHSSGIVFLETLGTMCHFSLRGGVDIFVLLFDCMCCLFLFKKKIAMLLIGHDLHHNCGLHVIGVFNLFEYCISLEIPVFDSRVGLERLHLFD